MSNSHNMLPESNVAAQTSYNTDIIPLWPRADEPCPLAMTIAYLSGRWKPFLLHLLRADQQHFSNMSRALPDVSRKVLSAQLRELQRDGLIMRTEYDDGRKRVLYSLSEKGASLIPILDKLYLWSHQNMREAATLATR